MDVLWFFCLIKVKDVLTLVFILLQYLGGLVTNTRKRFNPESLVNPTGLGFDPGGGGDFQTKK